jgi:FtsZ-interacting cell division protein ZipA
MTTTWIVGGIAVACLVVVAAWRLRKASGTLQRILDEERAETERQHADPEAPEKPEKPVSPAHRTRGTDG